MQWKYIFLLLCLSDQTKQTDKPLISTCQRIRRKVLLHHEMTTLTYINQMWKEIQNQQGQSIIRNSTADMIFQSLERMSHGWCDPSFKSLKKENKKEKKKYLNNTCNNLCSGKPYNRASHRISASGDIAQHKMEDNRTSERNGDSSPPNRS